MPPRKDTWPAEARIAESQLASRVSSLHAANRVHEKYSAQLEARVAQFAVREKRTYERGNGHSWIADQARVALGRGDGDGGLDAARQRLAAHQREVDAELPRLLARRDAEARAATEAALTGSLAEVRALERFTAAGGRIFGEQRAISRTDGQGGYFVGPLWAIEEFIPYAMAGRPFADLWSAFPLPKGVDEINLPRVTLGPATGTQASDLAPAATRDLADSFASAQVRTVAGMIDLPLIYLDQNPLDVDSVFLPMLLADYNTQVDGLALLGASVMGQPNGIMPAGSLAAGSLVSLQNTNNATGQSWAYGGSSIAGSPHFASAQLFSILSRLRAVKPTAWVVNELVWALMSAAADTSNRPLVPPGQGSPPGDGTHVGHLHGLPIVTDQGVPVSFASTTGGLASSPQIGPVTAGQVAATAGSGTYTPVLLGKWDDCFIWEGDYRLSVFREVESGNLNCRIRLHNYVAMIPNRFVWGGAGQTFSAANQAGGVNAGAAVSYGALTQMTVNSPLQSGTGF